MDADRSRLIVGSATFTIVLSTTTSSTLRHSTARILALTAAIWHNDQTGQDVKRSLIAYDH